MRTSILIALLAVSFTAVLAAPSHPKISHKSLVSLHKIRTQHNLKKIALPKFAIAPRGLAPRVDLPELIALISKALADIDAAIATAEAALTALLENVNSIVLERILPILKQAQEQLLEVVGDALARALEVPISELPQLILETVDDIVYIVGQVIAWIDYIIELEAPDLYDESVEILSTLIRQIEEALAPLIELISPPESHAIAKVPRAINLLEVIKLIRQQKH